MRPVLLAAFLLSAGCSSTSTQTPLATTEWSLAAGVHVTSRTVRYGVHATSIHALRAEMSRIGPLDDGRHQYAFTWGNFAWPSLGDAGAPRRARSADAARPGHRSVSPGGRSVTSALTLAR